MSGFIYPILGHWVWGPGGWLATMPVPFRDFAGSTVVHTVGGMIALAGAIVLGPRLGRKFSRDGGGMPAGHDMTLAAIGGVILWFGWYGFNPGSTLSALDYGASAGWPPTPRSPPRRRLVGAVPGVPQIEEVGHGHQVNGFLGGLVAITCPCYWVNSFGAICIGAVAGVVVVFGVDLLEYLRIDDPIGAVPVHGIAASGARSASGCSPPASSAYPGDRRRHALSSTASSGAAALISCGPRPSAASA